MPFRFQYHPSRDFLVGLGEGTITLQDIQSVRRATREAGVPHPVAATLTDLRRADIQLDLDTFREHEAEVGAEELVGPRQALLIEGAHPTALALLFKGWHRSAMEVEIFATPDAAYRWLGVEPADGDLTF